MTVGPAGGGKTCCMNALKAALSQLAEAEEIEEEFFKVNTHIMNPKAITQAQIYGAFDEVTHEWSDGIAAELLRVAVTDGKSGSEELHWIVFDGPVDALWIESMNTVLDDNKKLCLVSGEIITLTPQIRMIFEVEDLSVASPATVSRCGMIFMEPESLGLTPVLDSWITTLPSTFKPEFKDKIYKMVEKLALPSIPFVRKKCSELVTSTENNLLKTLFRLLDASFEPYVPQEGRKITPEDIDLLGR